MRGRGLTTLAAALALLAACDRAAVPPETARSAIPEALAPPVAPPATPSAAPVPPPTASESPAVEARDWAKPLVAFVPRDECVRLPGYPAFREALFAATAKRDADALVALADPAIHLDFGGGAGLDELRKRLIDPKGALWGEIAALARLGCAADGTVATLPAIFSRVPDDVDPGRTMLVTGNEVPLRRKPSPAASEVRLLDWALVTLKDDGFDPAARYTQVTAGDGSSGFVATAKLRSLLDYRLIADKGEGGSYRITALIAGD
ncbi:hypothetical protein [Novosphingobium sp. Gsoil 351]|uniref:hypothetical protein n=1 Tax=Novosphingobium sp. Gsoil 351 TaxID=2675225 RepID=UPI0012B498BD|nr:hypothetical protein [Novosphingobium sp. Gsoil 351]QGN53289.1 hypothetical protein GKE62_00660 [Novosphingobium sp. Gsoil 351]